MVPNRRYFTFAGKKYRYFVHPYHATWQNERAVEIPLLKPYVAAAPAGKTLEIGNVWGRYFPDRRHAVVDKYEERPGVTNLDVMDFKPKQKFDLVFSISTFEHIGLDEHDREPKKVLAAVNHSRTLLSRKGSLILTVPVGYNQYLDYLLESNQLGETERHSFKRVSRWMEWEACDYDEVRGAAYGSPYRYANALVLLVFKGPGTGKRAAAKSRRR